MNEIIFEIIKIVAMMAVLVVTRYLIPWLKEKIGADKLSQIEKWANYAVKMAQQVYGAKPGKDRKVIVTEFLMGILAAKNMALSDEQLDVLVEAAVKQMKIEEKAGKSTSETEVLK